MAGKKAVLYSFVFCLSFLTACQKEIDFGKYDYKTLGTSAHDLLAADPFPLLQIQISYMPGYAVDAETINNLVNFLSIYLNKPSGILVSQKMISSVNRTSLSLTEIVSIEKNNRSIFTSSNIITIHILITDGHFEYSDIFATSYWNTSTCIFGKAVDDYSGGPGQVSRSKLMSILLQHEMGHLLGLVELGSPMQIIHQDAANGFHCDNINCLMYYGIETSNSGSATSGNIPMLDTNCMNDLKANGGK
jgi:hypothetical protein